MDSNNDGVPDDQDLFPNDAAEQYDADGDGVGDNSDAFPNDASEQYYSDGNGVGDNAEQSPCTINTAPSLDGVYLGTYSVSIYNHSTGQTCSCYFANLTMAVQVGQGQQCLTDCAKYVTLNFTDSVAGGDTPTGQADDSNDYGFSSPWSGIFISGTAAGTIS